MHLSSDWINDTLCWTFRDVLITCDAGARKNCYFLFCIKTFVTFFTFLLLGNLLLKLLLLVSHFRWLAIATFGRKHRGAPPAPSPYFICTHFSKLKPIQEVLLK